MGNKDTNRGHIEHFIGGFLRHYMHILIRNRIYSKVARSKSFDSLTTSSKFYAIMKNEERSSETMVLTVREMSRVSNRVSPLP